MKPLAMLATMVWLLNVTPSQAQLPVPTSSPGLAQSPLPGLTPDRPGFTNGSDIVLVHKTQVEIGIADTRASTANGGAHTTDYPEALIRTGLTPKMEVRIGLPDYLSTPGSASGIGDASIGLKYKFYQSKDGNTKAALIPAVSLPTGTNGLSSGHYDPLLTIGVQTASGARWGVSGNVQLSDPTQNGRRNEAAAVSESVSYQLTSALAAYSELYDNVPRRGAATPITDAGITCLVNPNLQWDIEAGWGLNGAGPGRFIGGGVSARY